MNNQHAVNTAVPLSARFAQHRASGLILRSFAWPLLLLLAPQATSTCAMAAELRVAFRNTALEEGTGTPAGWNRGPAVAGVEQAWDQKIAHSGKASLCLRKTAQRYFPIAQWSQSVPIERTSSARKLRVRCWVKAEAVTKAIIDVGYQGVGQRPGHAWAVYLGQKQSTDPMLTHDWQLYEGNVELPANTSRISIAFQIYGPGSVWFDDLEVEWFRELEDQPR